MYPPFHVRNLYEEHGGIVQLGAAEYDSLAKEPEARLTYVDDDDGEIITVGTSLELQERLSEPAPSSRYSWLAEDLQDNPMHVFDVQQTERVLRRWRNFEYAAPEPTLKTSVTPANEVSIKVGGGDLLKALEDNARRYLSTNDSAAAVQDPREKWVQACQPPQLSPTDISRKEIKAIPSEAPKRSLLLTEKGQRLAKEAGDRLRWNDVCTNAIDKKGLKENRWASYQRMNHITTQPTAEREIPEPSFMEAFEAELAKHLVEDQPTDAQAADTTPSTSHEAANNVPPSAADQVSLQSAGEMVVQAVQALATGVGLLGSEMSRRYPELEEKLANVQHTLPTHIDDVVSEAIAGLDGHADKLSRALRHAADVSRHAAERTRQTDLQSIDDMLAGFAGFVGDVGKTLWANFDKDVTENGRSSLRSRVRDTEFPSGSQSPDNSTVTVQKDLSQKQASVVCPEPCLIGSRRDHERCVFRKSLANENKEPEDRPSHFLDPPTGNQPIAHEIKTTSRPVWQSNPHVNDCFQGVPNVLDFRHEAPWASAQRDPVYTTTDDLTDRTPNFHKFVPPAEKKRSSTVVAGTSQLRSMKSTPAFSHSTKPILDQEDGDPDFTARYPSLISSNNAPRRSNTTANPMSNSAFLRTMNPESEIARYPTVSQFERASSLGQQLPGAQSRSGQLSEPFFAPPATSIQDSTLLRQPPGAWPEFSADPKAGASKGMDKPSGESSGAFFERMTGRRASAVDDEMYHDTEANGNSTLHRAHTTAGITRSNPLVSSDPAARLPAPFDPLTDLADELHSDRTHRREERRARLRAGRAERETHRVERERQRAERRDLTSQENTYLPTSPQPISLWSQSSFPPSNNSAVPFQGSRRPYSMHFTGAGRTGALNSLIAHDLRSQTRAYRQAMSRPQSSLPDFHARAAPPFPELPNIAPSSTRPPPPQQTRRTTLPPSLSIQVPSPTYHRPPQPATHPSRKKVFHIAVPSPTSRDINVENCIAYLQTLGYAAPSHGNANYSGERSTRRGDRGISTHNANEGQCLTIERLGAIAMAANGDVAEAIEMIEEERRAWDRLNDERKRK